MGFPPKSLRSIKSNCAEAGFSASITMLPSTSAGPEGSVGSVGGSVGTVGTSVGCVGTVTVPVGDVSAGTDPVGSVGVFGSQAVAVRSIQKASTIANTLFMFGTLLVLWFCGLFLPATEGQAATTHSLSFSFLFYNPEFQLSIKILLIVYINITFLSIGYSTFVNFRLK
jgi:hypothetical protein